VRILVASERIGALSSLAAGRLIANAWPHAETLVVPVGEAGRGFAAAYADRLGGTVEAGVLEAGVGADVVLTESSAAGTVVLAVQSSGSGSGPPLYQATSVPLGDALLRAVRQGPKRVVLDLSGLTVHDAGAGLFAALGAMADVPLDRGAAGLSGLTEIDADSVRAMLESVELVGVVPDAELTRPLLGLRGITSLKAQTVHNRAAGDETEVLLATDAALERFAKLVDPAHANVPGSGACGGLGFAILALGGRLTTGPRLAFETTPVGRGLDLVLTGCETFDFASRGGGVVAEAARVAETALCPCVALAGEVLIGSREMRTMGIESAYAIRDGSAGHGLVTEAELTELARRVARSWTW
jgi:glycerate 2-kinase